MARTRMNADGTSTLETGYSSVKQLVRYIAKNASALASGADSIDVIDAELASYIDGGFELLNTHYIGENPEGIGMIYVLVKK